MLAHTRFYPTRILFFLPAFFLCSAPSWAAPLQGEGHIGFAVAQPIQKIELDIDRDGDLDYILVRRQVNYQGELEVWLNLGAGKWKSQGPIFSSILDPDLLLADIDHDGYADLIVRDRTSRSFPEIWVGGKSGLLERSRADFPLSTMVPGRAEARDAPPNLIPALLQDQRPKDHSSAVLRHPSAFRSDRAAAFCVQAQSLGPTRLFASQTRPRSPPTLI